jgi:hypothetical protein
VCPAVKWKKETNKEKWLNYTEKWDKQSHIVLLLLRKTYYYGVLELCQKEKMETEKIMEGNSDSLILL